MVNAAFAMATAIGAASGPGGAILLDMVPEFQFALPILGTQTFNGMTGPGFVMALLWFVFLIAIVVSFKEPNRSGLDELKQREAAAAESVHSEPLQSNDFTSVPSADDCDDDVSVGSLTVSSHREQEEVSKHSPLYCMKHITRATALCMLLMFMKRFALEVRDGPLWRCCVYASFPLFLMSLLAYIRTEHRWINVCHYQESICLVDKRRGNPSLGKRYYCDSCVDLFWMAVTIS